MQFLDLTVRGWLDELGEEGPAPGGGSAAAMTAAMGAALVGMAARISADSWPEARGICAQASPLGYPRRPARRTGSRGRRDGRAGDAPCLSAGLDRRRRPANPLPLDAVEQSGEASKARLTAVLTGDGREACLLRLFEEISVPRACEPLLDRVVHLRSLRVRYSHDVRPG